MNEEKIKKHVLLIKKHLQEVEKWKYDHLLELPDSVLFAINRGLIEMEDYIKKYGDK